MMFYKKFLAICLLASLPAFTACSDDETKGDEKVTFAGATTPGQQVTDIAGGVNFRMIYATNLESTTFPTGAEDDGIAVLTTKFFMAETQVTWELWKAVYDWAVHADRGDNLYTFQNVGRMGSVEDGFNMTNQHPVTMINWRDAVIWCNALSEMTGAEVVYLDKDTGEVLRSSENGVYDGNNVEDVVISEAFSLSRRGYRLPTSMEWEYAARYRGKNTTNVVTGTIGGYNFSSPSQGIYYTKGNSASGATTYHNNETLVDGYDYPNYAGKLANDAVAVYRRYYNGSSWNERPEYSGRTEEVAGLTSNALGLYDMSGNVWEWCFTKVIESNNRLRRRGGWGADSHLLRIGILRPEYEREPDNMSNLMGFRFARTQ